MEADHPYVFSTTRDQLGDPVRRGRPWQPGFLARFPWLGLGALSGSVIGIVVSVAILVASHGDPISKWRFQPTVYLSIASTATNVMLHFALTEGVSVAWWRRAMKDQNKLGDLHRFWDFGNSLWAATTAWRYLNFIALACIFTAIAPVNGPLLRRASAVKEGSKASVQTTLKLPLATAMPQGFTGILSGRGDTVSLYSQNFTPVVQDFYNRRDITMNNPGCEGACSAKVKGVGLAVSCSSWEEPYKLDPSHLNNGAYNASSDPAVMNGSYVFATDFFWSAGSPNNVTLRVRYKEKADCTGNLVVRQCSMILATVQYPVIVDGNKSTIALDESTNVFDDEIEARAEERVEMGKGETTFGGFYLALANKFFSSAHLRFAGAIGHQLNTTGAAALQFVNPDEMLKNEKSSSFCAVKFNDPTQNILSSARELMFRTAVSAAAIDSSIEPQRVLGVDAITRAVYASQYQVLAIATVITVVAALLVLATFHEYWHLGRKMTMSPVEVTKAFNAPLLRNPDSNAEVKDLVKEFGEQNVRYGAVIRGSGDEASDVSETVTKESSQLTTTLLLPDARHQIRLEMSGDQASTQMPRKGWKFSP